MYIKIAELSIGFKFEFIFAGEKKEGDGWQTRLNDVLREHVKQHSKAT